MCLYINNIYSFMSIATHTSIMDQLKTFLDDDGVLGVVRSVDGEIRTFTRRGVIDLFNLLTHDSQFLCGGSMADKVIGRGAALLLVKGGISCVHARLISNGALEVLTQNGIEVSYEKLVPNIINRKGDDICPVEKLTSSTSDANEAYHLIGHFLQNIN